MKDWIYISIIVLLACNFIIDQFKKKETKPESVDYSKAYQRRMLLTKNEWINYQKLKTAIESQKLCICPKVRLLDLVEPAKGTEAKRRQLLLNKVQSKHVDFVICDASMHVKLVVELDDSSHDTDVRKNRDNFVDTVLTSSGYKIVHIRNVEKELQVIQSALALEEVHTS